MAECYHFDCRPSNAAQDSFRTLMSQFDGTCTSCQEKYSKGDKIAYFGNKNHRDSAPSTRTQNASARGSEVSEKDFVALQRLVKEHDYSLSKLSVFRDLIDMVDWMALPMKNKEAQQQASVGNAVAILDGKEIEQGEGDDAF